MRKRPQFSIAKKDPLMMELVAHTDHKLLAQWAIACVLRVLHYFEAALPQDQRPQEALATLQAWRETGVFKMSVIRGASLACHAAARELGEDTPARSVARAAGQAVATAHVPRHAYGAAIYAQQAIFRDTHSLAAAEQERDWQYGQLQTLQLKGQS